MGKHVSMGFAQRLRQAMIHSGYGSTRSITGVCIHTLTLFTSHSRQICRKYLKGESLPEPDVVVKIATALNISPGWLLFGDVPSGQPNHIHIHPALLHYILTHELIPSQHHPLYSQFLMHLIQEVAQLTGEESHLKKVIDLAFTSIHPFQESNPSAPDGRGSVSPWVTTTI